ncbi:MAG: hypothetical protein IJE08_15045 [Clostridia bacterium]|nr:hypothetical protein [Clostridia bacterium]
MIKAQFERHPLFCTLILSVFASLPAGMVFELIALFAGPQVVTDIVRENMVLIYVTGIFTAQAFIGFQIFRKSRNRKDWLANAALWCYSFVMAVAAVIVFASAVIIILDAVTAGTSVC